MSVTAYIAGIGVYGPGLPGWQTARGLLQNAAGYAPAPMQLPTLDVLPPAERRRVGLAVKLALAIGFDALAQGNASFQPEIERLPTVFVSTSGECETTHQLLEALATTERAVSPTRFHNSVHNAPAGYWSIAAQSRAASTSLCAYDATFAAGLLEAATQCQTSNAACLLLAYDTAYPEPLFKLRPIPNPFGVALLLTRQRIGPCDAKLILSPAPSALPQPLSQLSPGSLETLRHSTPAARSLPLLQLLAQQKNGALVIDYLEHLDLSIAVDHAV